MKMITMITKTPQSNTSNKLSTFRKATEKINENNERMEQLNQQIRKKDKEIIKIKEILNDHNIKY